jgi:multiple sugar transport system substrate-binding protein
VLAAHLPISLAEASQKTFDGVEITVGVQNVSAIGGPAKEHAKTWEQRTGGKAVVVEFPFRELFEKFYEALSTGTGAFDVILYAPAWAGDFVPYLSEIPADVADDPSFDDIHPVYRDRLMQWGNKRIAITVDGDLFSGYYRRDLFEDSRYRLEFRQRYGYELAAPNTWKEYRDIAEFFTGREGPDGQKLYGTVEAFSRGGQQFWNLFSRASAYANHPDHPGAQFFDPDTMQAHINNPAWVRAVKEYVEIVDFSPPGALKFGIVEAREPFVQGQTAMILDWGDTAQISANPKKSKVLGKVGYFVLPGTMEVWDYVQRRWDRMGRPHKAPFLAFGGWVGSVAKSSKQQAAAWDYLMWYSNPENSLRDVVTSGTGVNPYRYTHFTNIDAWTKALTRRAASEYLGMLKTSIDSPHVALDLRIPGFFDYTEALEIELERALKKEVSARLALDRVAVQWEQITERRGREEQKTIYRASMELPPQPPMKQAKYVIGFSQATTTEPWRLLFMSSASPRPPQPNRGVCCSTRSCVRRRPSIRISSSVLPMGSMTLISKCRTSLPSSARRSTASSSHPRLPRV